ncbi:DUF956 family protein [Lactococcus nasutitermitis]|uniref:DUF956 family protein n=1 Tax=Lactococcus nasutitermitis TaxID=1652957 RepID=A0ABV9JCB5_9LACT|nr:DUF956 family protein [Lactococcus nasutitermitis]
MVESINTRADLATEAIAYLGFPKYGKIMIGDKGMEFFSDRNVADNMAFPWASIRAVEGRVTHDKKIGKNFYLILNNKHKIRFSSRQAGHILKLVRDNIGNDNVVKSSTFVGTFAKAFKRIGKKKK